MELEDVRLHLLAQHDTIRKYLDEVRVLSKGDGRAQSQALREALERLRAIVVDHCLTEEALLGPLLATVDAWGAVRVRLMDREHGVEHERLLRDLEGFILSSSPAERIAAVRAMSDELREHMDEEEKHLLSPRVLTYDVVRIGQAAG
ncbi:MAG: hemerythrin domain-containing protein [Myxococcaceae bacterium]